MQEGRVVNIRKEPYDVYIGRPSKWGNCFTWVPPKRTKLTMARSERYIHEDLHIVGSREEAIEAYEAWILTQPQLLEDLHELKNQVLGCFCAPLPCHGEILVRLHQQV